ncbi:DUF3365 domain-containing protein [bacterium]|nr:DUF3365 domain-containing protein [bacterium]
MTPAAIGLRDRRLGLLLKINVILVSVFLVTVAVVGYLSQGLMEEQAREQVLANARILAQTAAAVRSYTSKQIQPILHSRPSPTFQPQTVPSYSAQEVFKTLRERYPSYDYKEVALNPTNQKDKAVEWEAKVVNDFRKDPQRKEVVGERDTPEGRSLFLAEPITISMVSCLKCHSTPEKAPKTMTAMYGTSNGFGWEVGETIGARIVSVPMQVAKTEASRAFRHLFGSFVVVFSLLLLVLNALLHQVVVKPIRRLSKVADEVSMGNLDAPPFEPKGNDEVSALQSAFNRMRISLEKSMKMLEELG